MDLSPRVPRTRVLLLALLLLAAVGGPAAAWPRVVGRDRQHVVARGETLQGIAARYGLAASQLEEANRLTGEPAPGRTLRVPGRRVLPPSPPRDGLVVNLAERGVYVFRDGRFRAFYPVAVGTADRPTPTGAYRITSLVKNPTWLPPEWAGIDEAVVPPGPDNPLGDRWIGLSAPGVGLHATRDVDSVGRAASHGCMRMIGAMAHALFGLARKGMPVRIEDEPVRVGWDERAMTLVLAVYADPYRRHALEPYAVKVLRRQGLAGLVDLTRVHRIARARLGRPFSLGLAARPVTVNGRRLAWPALIAAGRAWVPAAAARVMGVRVTWRGDRLELSDATRVLRLPVDPHGQQAARLVEGHAYLPARVLRERLGAGLALTSTGVVVTTSAAVSE